MSQTNKQIADNIRKVAKSKGVTVKKTLDDCDINRNFLYDLERGNSSPSVDKLSRIAEYFGVSMSKLLGGDDGEIAIILELYEKLSEEGKSELRKFMQSLIEE